MTIARGLGAAFIKSHPAEAARSLEQVSTQYVAELISMTELDKCAPMVGKMLPHKAADLLEAIEPGLAASLMMEIPLDISSRIYTALAEDRKHEIQQHLDRKYLASMQHYLDHASDTVGAIMQPLLDILPDNLTVGEALRRIYHLPRTASCEIYLTDEDHRLTGLVDIGVLVHTQPNRILKNIARPNPVSVSVFTSISSLLEHPSWEFLRKLPVVERNHVLIGILDYHDLRKATEDISSLQRPDPMQIMLSLAGMYWISLAQIIDSFMAVAGSEKDKP